jgi:hypothetical protein
LAQARGPDGEEAAQELLEELLEQDFQPAIPFFFCCVFLLEMLQSQGQSLSSKESISSGASA